MDDFDQFVDSQLNETIPTSQKTQTKVPSPSPPRSPLIAAVIDEPVLVWVEKDQRKRKHEKKDRKERKDKKRRKEKKDKRGKRGGKEKKTEAKGQKTRAGLSSSSSSSSDEHVLDESQSATSNAAEPDEKTKAYQELNIDSTLDEPLEHENKPKREDWMLAPPKREESSLFSRWKNKQEEGETDAEEMKRNREDQEKVNFSILNPTN